MLNACTFKAVYQINKAALTLTRLQVEAFRSSSTQTCVLNELQNLALQSVTEDQATPSILEAFAPALRESEAEVQEDDDEVLPRSIIVKAGGGASNKRAEPQNEGAGQEVLPAEAERDRVLFAFGLPDKARVKGLAAKSGLPARNRTDLEQRKQLGRKAVIEDAEKRRKVEAIFAKAEQVELGQTYAEGIQEAAVNKKTGAEVI